MDTEAQAMSKLAKSMQSRITKALSDSGATACDEASSEIVEDAIVATLKDFAHEHPLHVTVTVDGLSDAGGRGGFMRCALREHRPSLEDAAAPGKDAPQ